MYRELDAGTFEALHAEVFTDDAFIEKQLLQHSPEPSRRIWHSIPRRQAPGNLLEIGPGTGHLMAAAAETGWQVAGVEHSRIHREHIRATWGMEVLDSLDAVPMARRFDLILMVNVLEHVFDVHDLLSRLKPLLAPEGEIFISAPNAQCLVAQLAGTRWSMFKPTDHVSLPSAEGLRRLGERTGLVPAKVWSTELPLETPLGFLVAWRDRAQLQEGPTAAEEASGPGASAGGWKHRLMRLLNRMDARWEPTNRLMGWWGRAGSIKVTYRLPEP